MQQLKWPWVTSVPSSFWLQQWQEIRDIAQSWLQQWLKKCYLLTIRTDSPERSFKCFDKTFESLNICRYYLNTQANWDIREVKSRDKCAPWDRLWCTATLLFPSILSPAACLLYKMKHFRQQISSSMCKLYNMYECVYSLSKSLLNLLH